MSMPLWSSKSSYPTSGFFWVLLSFQVKATSTVLSEPQSFHCSKLGRYSRENDSQGFSKTQTTSTVSVIPGKKTFPVKPSNIRGMWHQTSCTASLLFLSLPSAEWRKAVGRLPGASHVWESKQPPIFDGEKIRAQDTFYAATLRSVRCRPPCCALQLGYPEYTQYRGGRHACVCVCACLCTRAHPSPIKPNEPH